MTRIFQKLNAKKSQDIKVLSTFISIFCREAHRSAAKGNFTITDGRLRHMLADKQLSLCADCRKLLNHAIAKLLLCPYDPKPMCKKCPTHCYAPGYREQIRKVMKFSGLYLIKHGRLDLLIHYWF
jgi:hypothetical protein